MPANIDILDYWTNYAIEILWKIQVNECKQINETSTTEDSNDTSDTTIVIV